MSLGSSVGRRRRILIVFGASGEGQVFEVVEVPERRPRRLDRARPPLRTRCQREFVILSLECAADLFLGVEGLCAAGRLRRSRARGGVETLTPVKRIREPGHWPCVCNAITLVASVVRLVPVVWRESHLKTRIDIGRLKVYGSLIRAPSPRLRAVYEIFGKAAGMSDAQSPANGQDGSARDEQQHEQGQVEHSEQDAAPELPGPGAFLKGVVGQHVVVRLNSGVDYRGALPLRCPPPDPHVATHARNLLAQESLVASTGT